MGEEYNSVLSIPIEAKYRPIYQSISTQKNTFKQPLNHRQLGISFQDLIPFKVNLGPLILSHFQAKNITTSSLNNDFQ